jgi:GTP-binding protein HflX
VVDIAHPQHEEHIKTVQATLQDLGAGDKPMIMVFNKVDLYQERNFDQFLDAKTKKEILINLSENLRNNFGHDNIFISATNRENIDALRDKMAEMISIAYQERYPFRTKEW